MGFTTDFYRDIIQADPGAISFREGEQAQKSGRPRTDNPHQEGQPRAQWFKGWDHAAQNQDYHAGWNARLNGEELDATKNEEWRRGWHTFDDWAASQI